MGNDLQEPSSVVHVGCTANSVWDAKALLCPLVWPQISILRCCVADGSPCVVCVIKTVMMGHRCCIVSIALNAFVATSCRGVNGIFQSRAIQATAM
jgi:hypothetical protein